MNEYPLAVFAPSLGAPSETFIRRHIEEILPARTVAIAYNDNSQIIGNWHCKATKLSLNKLKTCEMKFGLWDRLASRIGIYSQSAVQVAALRKFLVQKRSSVFMGEYLDSSLPFLPVVKEMGLRFFVHAHGYDVSQKLRDPYYCTEYAKYVRADGLITVNQIQKRRLIEIGLPHDKIHVIPCGVDIPDCQPERTRGELIHCLSVGRMVGKKAPLLLLDAFRRAAHKFPDLHLDYIGGGPLFTQAEKYVIENKLQRFVTLHGTLPVDKVHSFMRRSEIFVQHSIVDETGDEEGLPVAILEAMAHALPVIATRHSGIPEAVIENETGLLVSEGDTIAMAEAIVSLARSQARCIAMGEAGQVRARENFSSQRELSLLRQLLFET